MLTPFGQILAMLLSGLRGNVSETVL